MMSPRRAPAPVKQDMELQCSAEGTTSDEAEPLEQRWTLIRDILVFQGKLLIDGLRDLLLAPAAWIAGIVALFSTRKRAERLFYDVLRIGYQAERWINLFGVIERYRADKEDEPVDTIDCYIERLEHAMRQQAARGGVTQTTKARIDAIIDSIQGRQTQRERASKEE